MTVSSLTIDTDDRGVATITLNRAVIHNAFDDLMIAELLQALEIVETDQRVRLLVLRAKGDSFSAGADLNWMRRVAAYDRDRNVCDAQALGLLLNTLDTLARPTIARVQGAAYGGGVGLVSCCDIAIASEQAIFSLSEVRLGLIPAVIGPYVVNAIGRRAARRYFLTGERFDAREALRLGLVHRVVPHAELDDAVAATIDTLGRGGPSAQAAAKRLIADIAGRPVDSDARELTARRIADVRASHEGKEGLDAFLNKRPPAWRKRTEG